MELCSLPAIYLGPNYGGGNVDNGDLLQKVPCSTTTLSAPSPAAGHCWPTLPLATPGYSWASLVQSLVGHCCFFWVLVNTRFCLCPPRVYFPVLCKFWQLYSGVNDDLVQEALCHTQVCCTQRPCRCGSPLLTSTGDTQTQFCLSICGVSGSWCAQALFEPSEHLWWEWDLILNMNLPPLPSSWGFSLPLDVGYLLKDAPALHSCCSSAYHLAGDSLPLIIERPQWSGPVHTDCRVRWVSSASSGIRGMFSLFTT